MKVRALKEICHLRGYRGIPIDQMTQTTHCNFHSSKWKVQDIEEDQHRCQKFNFYFISHPVCRTSHGSCHLSFRQPTRSRYRYYKGGREKDSILCRHDCMLLPARWIDFVDNSVPGIYLLFGRVFHGHSVGILVRSVWSQTSSSDRTLGIIDLDADVWVVYHVLASCLFPLFAGNFQR